MDIDELQSVQSRERQTDSLQQLREPFYREASEYIQQLRDARDEAAQRADDPWDDPEVSRLSDEINTAEQAVEAIYERRTGKIVKQASLAAAGMPADEDGLTAEEADLFEALVAEIESNRGHVLDLIAGDVSPDAAPPQQPSSGATPADPNGKDSTSHAAESESAAADDGGVSAADVMGGDSSTPNDAPSPPDETVPGDDTGPASTDPDQNTREEGAPAETESRGDASQKSDAGASDSGEEPGLERETVKITSDVGEILGVDQREYDLGRNDIVQLPAANADPLVDRDAAERID